MYLVLMLRWVKLVLWQFPTLCLDWVLRRGNLIFFLDSFSKQEQMILLPWDSIGVSPDSLEDEAGQRLLKLSKTEPVSYCI